jgi:hypothetical protein
MVIKRLRSSSQNDNNSLNDEKEDLMTEPIKPVGVPTPLNTGIDTTRPVVGSKLTQDQKEYLLKVYSESFANPNQFKDEVEKFKKALEAADFSATNSKGNNFKGNDAFEFKRMLANRANELGRSNDPNALNAFATKLAKKEGNPTGVNFGIEAVRVALIARKSESEAAPPQMAPAKPVNPADVAMQGLVGSLPNIIADSKKNASAKKLQEFYGDIKTFMQGVESDKAFSEAFNAAQSKAGNEKIEMLLKAGTTGQVIGAVHAFVQTEDGKKFTAIAQQSAAILATYEALGAVEVK